VTAELIVLAGVCGVAYAAMALSDARLPRLVLTAFLAGLLIANKSFATLGVGEIYVMEVGLGLAVLGVLLHPVTRARVASSNLPLIALTGFLLLGGLNLARGTEHGVLALKDSVINFYAVAVILPVALFPDLAAATAFLRRLLPPLVIGSIAFSAIQALSLAGVGGSPILEMTNPTVTAAAAAGLLFVILGRRPFDLGAAAVAFVLAGAIAIGLSRSVWVGCVLAAVALWAVARLDRARLARVATVGVISAAALLTVLALADARAPRLLQAEVVSFLFRPSEDSADNAVGNARWRLTAWNDLIDGRIRDNVVFGEGFGRPALEESSVTANDERVQAHNGFLTYALREGLVGLAIFLLLVGAGLARCVRAARLTDSARERAFALALLGALCVYLGDIAFAVVIEGPMGGIPFWLLVGLTFMLAPAPQFRAEPEEAPSDPETRSPPRVRLAGSP
jgi:O-antigen ligase